ncbi:ComEA family DNA-binding protein [Streptomyces cavernicola]|uniref:ComEA family DNA-binding protein n=1 Tax=Streptomyces cavernicola TaxID=3043613 RepID=UPI0032B78231
MRERLPLWLQLRCGVERRSLIALAVVLVVAVGFAVLHFWSGEPRSVRAPEAVGEATVPDLSSGAAVPSPGSGGTDSVGGQGASGEATGVPGADGVAGGRIVVDVSGKVRSPGIHRLPAGARVADALEAAGGVRSGADITSLNRARLLMDGEQVVVGVPAAPGQVGVGGSASTGTTSSGASGGAAGAGPGAGAGAAPVSLNTATVDQLDTLPGVGPVLAQHIVDYRTQHGGFRSVDELREVNGIGDRRFADLKNAVRP